MRELKGDWRDLFNGFIVALDLRKMFLGFAGLLATLVVCGGGTFLVARQLVGAEALYKPTSYAPDEFWILLNRCGAAICSNGSWVVRILYYLSFLTALFSIWAFFGGAISRIAAYEIAKDGERIETSRALKFAKSKFWAFFFAPVICVIGFLFFWFCNFAAGFAGDLLDVAWIGGPLMALFLPLAILSGFIMVLIGVGSLTGFPLFTPAVAAEGTDSFDAVSRGFSYVYSRPWNYFGYQVLSAAYGYICIAFVFLFTVAMADTGLKAGAAGFDAVRVRGGDDRFSGMVDHSWSLALGTDHVNYPCCPLKNPREIHPYGAVMHWASKVADPAAHSPEHRDDKAHGLTQGIISAWVFILLGLAYGYSVSYFYSQQTMIYYILRKKVDGIEMNEVFDESEENLPVPPAAAPTEAAKPADKKDEKK